MISEKAIRDYIKYKNGINAQYDMFADMVAPLMRRVNYSQFASQMVTVQPMKMPTGKIFYLDYKYGDERDKSVDAKLRKHKIYRKIKGYYGVIYGYVSRCYKRCSTN